jgi:hypothetical protein
MLKPEHPLLFNYSLATEKRTILSNVHTNGINNELFKDKNCTMKAFQALNGKSVLYA